MSRALAPANPSFAEFAFRSDFFRSLFSRAGRATKSCWALASAVFVFSYLQFRSG
jgi:hypothetical protein